MPPELGARGSELGHASGVDAPGTSTAGDGGLQLNYVRRFLREAGEGTMPESAYDGNYDQLVGYLRGRLHL